MEPADVILTMFWWLWRRASDVLPIGFVNQTDIRWGALDDLEDCTTEPGKR